MKNPLRNFFSFTRREGIGIFLLSLIVIGLLIYHVSDGMNETEIGDFSAFENDINLFNAALKTNNQQQIEEAYTPITDSLFYFNPDTADSLTWLSLGLYPKQAASIMKYKRKGGRFYKKEDVQKMYAINDSMYKRLEPYIRIPEKPAREKFFKKHTSTYPEYEKKSKSYTPTKLEMNKADSLQWVALKGIGPVLANRILEYRKKLGGFIHVSQLQEVYGIKPEVFAELNQLIFIESTFEPEKIPINTADYNRLKNHPYISHNLAKSMLAYRTQHGNYKHIADLKKIHLFTDEIYSKLVPYLSLE